MARINAADETKRLCPLCESEDTSAGFNGSYVGHAGRMDKATAGCHVCGALWDEVFYRRTSETVISNVRPGALAAALNQDANQDAGCPICAGLHIGITPHGNQSASCTCVDCGATWDQRYDAIARHAYRSNIKEAAPG